MTNLHKYSFAEELANSISHGLGLLLSVSGLTLMILVAVANQDGNQLASAIVFGTSLIVMYLASTLYHSIIHPKAKAVLKLCDHCAIYVLIAGTYTPFLLISMEGFWGYAMLVKIWLLAILGIVFKLVYRHKYPKLSLATYMLMGWMIVFIAPSMIANVPNGGLILLVSGGLAYSLGAVFYAVKSIPYNHAIWHAFVLAGSVCHFLSVYLFVME